MRRFVRVACPARGTTLASGRLDRWLSVVNLLTGNGLVGDAADFLLAVVKERTDPRTLPGLEAMMPGSALTRLLQHPELVTTADLSVIAGDVEGAGLWAQLKLLAVDWFYGADHDLVVNTGSMYGGIRRPEGGARFLRDQGEQVTHFNYFSSPKTVAWLVAGLLREEAGDGGFAPIAAARQEEPRWRAAVLQSRAAVLPRPIAVVVPGTMGSALSVRRQAGVAAYWALLRGGLADIGWGAEEVEVGDLVGAFYGPLLEHLARTHRVEIFPTTGAQSVTDSARRLAQRLEALTAEAERTAQPVHIVAHSMGGLVEPRDDRRRWRRRGGVAAHDELARQPAADAGHAQPRLARGGALADRLQPDPGQAGLLDLAHGIDGIIDIVRRFPGMVELLPFDDPARFAAAGTVEAAARRDSARGLPLVDEAALRHAAATWTLLRGARPTRGACSMWPAARGRPWSTTRSSPTTCAHRARRLDFIATAAGDGTVSWASGRLAGVPMFYAPDTAHDELCSKTADRRIFRGYLELLTTGKTDQLSTSPPRREPRRGRRSR